MNARSLFVPFGLAMIALPAQEPADREDAFTAALPPRVESLWTRIPFHGSLTEALLTARQRRQPVFLYVNDGDPGSGRC